MDKFDNDLTEFHDPTDLWSRLFGFPIWTEDYNGDKRRRRARRNPDGTVTFTDIVGRSLIGKTDGSVTSPSYVKKWYRR